MGFTSENGYIPSSIETILDTIRVSINTQFGTEYTTENFIGSNLYKVMYAAAQEMQKNEIKSSEIFMKLTQYFALTNEMIQRPVATPPGLIELFESEGYTASVKPPLDADAGKLFIAVDVDDEAVDYADTKLTICTLISQSVAAGIVTQGTEVETIVLPNGQDFDFKYNLPNRIEPLLRLTVTLSDNNQVFVQSPETVKALLLSNITARYRIGRDFEPQRYFTTSDAPWSSQVLLEYSLDAGATWLSVIYEADYDDLFEILLENITLVED